MKKEFTDEDYYRFALSTHGEKLTEDVAKRTTVVENQEGLKNYFLDVEGQQKFIMGKQEMQWQEPVYFDSLKCRIYLDWP